VLSIEEAIRSIHESIDATKQQVVLVIGAGPVTEVATLLTKN
jgi:inosine-uridine nucleoside N-ribohydrolase